MRAVEAALAQERFVDPAVPPRGSRGKLTRRQREILQLLADGESTTVAARELGLSEETSRPTPRTCSPASAPATAPTQSRSHCASRLIE